MLSCCDSEAAAGLPTPLWWMWREVFNFFIPAPDRWHTWLVAGPWREETMNSGRSRFPHPEEEMQNGLTQTVRRSGRKGLSLGLYQICKILSPSVTRCCPRGATPPMSSLSPSSSCETPELSWPSRTSDRQGSRQAGRDGAMLHCLLVSNLCFDYDK